MTVLDVRNAEGGLAPVVPLPRGDTAPGFRLRQLLDGAGRGCFDVVAAPGGLDGRVGGVTIWDPQSPPAAGDLVLVTGTAEPAPVLEKAGRLGVAAVVVKGDLDLHGLRAAAARSGVPLLAAAARLSWDDVCALARSLVPAARFGVTPSGRNGAGGLFELAECAALVLDGPVSITDASLRVLAFANLGHAVDRITAESIMTRRAPEALRERFAAAGLTGTGGTGRVVRRVEVAGAPPRLVAPIVVRDAVAGYACLAEGTRPFGRGDARVLSDVAATAAGWFLDPAPGPGDEDALRADLLRGLLAGRGSLEVLARELGRAGQTSWCLIGLAGHGGGDAAGDGAVPVLARTARMLCPGATATVLDGVAFVLAPHRPGAHGTGLAERLRERCRTLAGVEVVACLSDPFTAGTDLPGLRCLLERSLAVLAARDTAGCGTLAELRPHAVIAELARLAAHHPGLLDGPLDALRRAPSPRNAEYMTSLAVYFDTGCDLTRAARTLRVHRNTLRYRLQRIEQLCAVDLEDPVERFTLELQVRLLVLRGRS